MSRLLAVAGILLAFAAGFYLGRARDAGRAGRSHGAEASGNRRVVLAEDEVIELRRKGQQYDSLERREEALREENARLKKALEPKPGERREDGTIVGGAKWNATFEMMATGFLDSMLAMFMRDAKFSPAQERKFRKLVDDEIHLAMAITADFTNGDIDADTTYDRLEAAYGDAVNQLNVLLDDDQMAVYRRFEKNVKGIMHNQVVHNELAAMKDAVGLDLEQEKRVREILNDRYRRVTKDFPLPIPNVLLKPIRRGKDARIYEETRTAIRNVLRPGQWSALEQFEASAPNRPYLERRNLEPKG